MWLEIVRSERNLKRDEVILVNGCAYLGSPLIVPLRAEVFVEDQRGDVIHILPGSLWFVLRIDPREAKT